MRHCSMCRLHGPTTIRWRVDDRDQLSPAALDALQQFYAADWAFLELAQNRSAPCRPRKPWEARCMIDNLSVEVHAGSTARDRWAVVGCWAVTAISSSTEMTEAVTQSLIDKQDPVALGQPITVISGAHDDLVVITVKRGSMLIWIRNWMPSRSFRTGLAEGSTMLANSRLAITFLSHGTELRDELMEIAWQQLTMPPEGHLVGFLDDDLCLRTSDINTLLAMAISRPQRAQHALHLRTPQQPGWRMARPTGMYITPSAPHRREPSPLYSQRCRRDLTMPCLTKTKSAYGYDRFALPLCAAHLNCWKFAAIDCAPMSHLKPLGSVTQQFSNGLKSKEEELLVRQRLMLAMGFPIDQPLYEHMERLWDAPLMTVLDVGVDGREDRQLAEAGIAVHLIDKRSHIGGNAFDESVQVR